jgi:hypothetical protein
MIIFLEKSTRKESNGYYCQISESEIQSFNQQWTTYEGKQGGSNIKLLLQKVIVNCNTNAQEETRLVDLAITRPNLEGKNVILPITV